jgi:hypothetical protein
MKNHFSLLFLFLALTYWQPLLAQAPVSGFTSTTLSTGWDEAVGLTFNKSGSQMFVWERPGRVSASDINGHYWANLKSYPVGQFNMYYFNIKYNN